MEGRKEGGYGMLKRTENRLAPRQTGMTGQGVCHSLTAPLMTTESISYLSLLPPSSSDAIIQGASHRRLMSRGRPHSSPSSPILSLLSSPLLPLMQKRCPPPLELQPWTWQQQ